MRESRDLIGGTRAALAGFLVLFSLGTGGAAEAISGSQSLDRHPIAPIVPSAPFVSATREARSFGDRYSIGDQLKVSFFQSLFGSQDSLGNLIERSELSGEYSVQQDGTIFFPLVGRVVAAGREAADLVADVEAKFSKLMEGDIRIVAQIISREPIYIVGAVQTRGSVKHLPGMIVLHALALAGSLNAVSNESWRHLDLSRERERLSKTEQNMARLLARAAVIIGEKNGADPSAPVELVKLVGDERSKELIAGESRLRQLDRSKRLGEKSALHDLIVVMKTEQNILRERLAHTASALQEKKERAAALQRLRSRGTVTEASLHLARSELTQAKERWHEIRTALAQLERRILETQQQITLRGVENVVETERELRTVVENLADERISRNALNTLFLTFPEEATLAKKRAGSHFRIIRREVNGLKTISADELTELRPGDVLNVGFEGDFLTGSVAPPSVGN